MRHVRETTRNTNDIYESMFPEEMAGLWGEWSTKENSLFSLTTLWEDWVQILSVDFFLSMYWFLLHECMGAYVPRHTWGRGYLTGRILSFHHVGHDSGCQAQQHLYPQSLSLACHWWLYENVWKQEDLAFKLRFAPALSPSWDWVLSVSFSVLPRCMKNYPGKPQVLKRATGLVQNSCSWNEALSLLCRWALED